ncbi:MAG: hypothetical protein JOZ69_23830 [Myxococcales bacterium]|nr:hypothetical protein [Myxococcales bacterium]
MRQREQRLAGAYAIALARAPGRGRASGLAAILGVGAPLFGVAFGAIALAGCTPAIGDKCSLSTDCSIQGTRFCDTSQTAGYCTVIGCTSNHCPDNAVCVEFGATVPGCAYDDYQAPSRTGRSMCMKACSSDSDCRTQDGYGCRDLSRLPDGGPPLEAGVPYEGVLLDTNRSMKVCIQVMSPVGSPPDGAAADDAVTVCSANRVPLPDAAGGDSSADAGAAEGVGAGDAAFDATLDGGGPGDGAAGDATLDGGGAGDGAAGDATLDAAADAGDAMIDAAAADGAPDAGAVDAADDG